MMNYDSSYLSDTHGWILGYNALSGSIERSS